MTDGYSDRVLTDAQISGLTPDEITELVRRLESRRSEIRRGGIMRLLVDLLAGEGITGVVRLELGTWEWDDGYFPYFGDVAVLLSDGTRVGIEFLDDGQDKELAELITSEARGFGLGERSQITIDMASGVIDVEGG